MKLNYDCMRDILLFLENNLAYTDDNMGLKHKRFNIGTISSELESKHDKFDVQYSIEKLAEINYIRLVDVNYSSERYIISGYIDDITMYGYDFLEQSREYNIWNATKDIAYKIGVTSIRMLGTIATTIITEICKQQPVISLIETTAQEVLDKTSNTQ